MSSLASEADNLALALVENADDPARVLAIGACVASLAADLCHRARSGAASAQAKGRRTGFLRLRTKNNGLLDERRGEGRREAAVRPSRRHSSGHSDAATPESGHFSLLTETS